MRKRFLFMAAALFFSACFVPQAMASGEGQLFGTVLGAGLGGWFGSQFGAGFGRDASIVAGGATGAYIGNVLGRSLDNSGSSSRGSGAPSFAAAIDRDSLSSSSGNGYRENYVAPDAPSPDTVYGAGRGGACAQYALPVRVNGTVQQHIGVACRQPDGTWRAVQ